MSVFDKNRAIPSFDVTRVMLDLLDLKPTDKLMEIGTGSGVQTAMWASKCAEVDTIERKPFANPEWLPGNVYVHAGDGRKGIPTAAPFDAIVITCGINELYDAWNAQLVEGGRLVAPVGNHEIQKVTLFRKTGNQILPEKIGAYARFQMME